VTGEWRKLHNEELHDLYSSPCIIRIIKSRRMSGRDTKHEWGRRGTLIGYWWVSQRERETPLGRPKHWWVDNVKMDLGEVGWGDVDWIGLAQDRNRWRALVNSVLNLRVP
jgi:hypothetical protein